MCSLPLLRQHTRLGTHRLSPFGGQGLRACVAWLRRGGKGWPDGKNIYAGVRAKLFCIAIYCNKPRPDTGPQSIYRSHRGMGRRDPQIMWKYDLTTDITIRPLTQPRTCEIGSSSFSTISRLEFLSTTSASFPIMPSTERRERETCLCWLWQCLPCLSLFYLYHC